MALEHICTYGKLEAAILRWSFGPAVFVYIVNWYIFVHKFYHLCQVAIVKVYFSHCDTA